MLNLKEQKVSPEDYPRPAEDYPCPSDRLW